MTQQWKPISSAPQDGTPVLLFARLDSAEASTRVVGAYHDSLGWFAQSYSHQKIAQVVPSHWMELPPFPDTPPASAQDDAKDAARYRWLRDPQSDVALVLDKRTGYVPADERIPGIGGYHTYEYRAGEELDAAIDEAIAASQQQEG